MLGFLATTTTPTPLGRSASSCRGGGGGATIGQLAPPQTSRRRRRRATTPTLAAAATERPAASVSRRHAIITTITTSTATLLLPTPHTHARTAPGDWSSPGLASRPEDDEQGPLFTKTPGGARLQVVDAGSRGQPIDPPPLGEDGAVRPGDRVELDYTLRRQNGYFIYGTVEGVSFQPRDVPTGVVEIAVGGACGGIGERDGPGGAPAVIRGLEEALVGLREGARFRVLVPPGLGYTDGGAGGLGPLPPTFATKRQLLNHVREPLLFEVEVLKVKKAAAAR
jgi:hypothetical protein